MNWRGFMSKYGIYQFVNYYLHLFIKKPMRSKMYHSLYLGGYLTKKQAFKLIWRNVLKKWNSISR